MAFHSERAKAGTRKQIDLQIKTIKANIASLEKEHVKTEKYLGKGLNDAFINKALKNINATIALKEKQLADYEATRAKYEKDGLI